MKIKVRIFTNVAAITTYLVNKAANASMNSQEFINDPRHPDFRRNLEKRKQEANH